jgi:hypothetical protein
MLLSNAGRPRSASSASRNASALSSSRRPSWEICSLRYWTECNLCDAKPARTAVYIYREVSAGGRT